MNNRIPVLTFLSGLPASGKSTFGNRYTAGNGILLSSDSLRLELYGDANDQSHNPEIFDEMFRRMRNYLASGVNITIDATNISAKKRISSLQGLSKDIQKKIIYFGTPFEICVNRDLRRDRVVSKGVIDRMYRSFQIPTYAEGWDTIELVGHEEKGSKSYVREYIESNISNPSFHEKLFNNGFNIPSPLNYMVLNNHDLFRDIYNLPHDSKYHSLSVSRHEFHVWEYVLDNYRGSDLLEMLYAALLHDTGKFHCKEFKRGARYANFIGHEFVGAQLAFNFLYELGYDDSFILRVVELVQMHMRLLNVESGENGDKSRAKLKSSVTNLAVYDKLVFLREADLQAH